MVKFYSLAAHETRDSSGRKNGFILPLWKDYDEIEEIAPRYIYFTTCEPGFDKGPYFHTKRRGLITLLEGRILFIYKEHGVYRERLIDAEKAYTLIDIPAKTPYLIRNNSQKTAKLINICDYPWKKGDDETIVPDFGDYLEKGS